MTRSQLAGAGLFQSTLSVRRATWRSGERDQMVGYFNPRSP